MDPGPKSNGPGSKIKSGSDHCGEPPETVAGGSHVRQCPRKKLWGVISGSPHTPIVSFDSPQRVPSAAQSTAVQRTDSNTSIITDNDIIYKFYFTHE